MAVKQTFVGDAKQLTRELQKVQREYAKLSQQVQNSVDTSKKGGQDSVKSLGLQLGSVLSVTAAYQKFNEALQRSKQLQQEALAEGRKAGDATAGIVRNFGANLGSVQDFIDQSEVIRRQAGISDVNAFRGALSAALSSVGGIEGPGQGGLNAGQVAALETVGAAARLFPDDPQSIGKAASSALGLRTQAGTGGPEQTLGLLLSTATLSKVTDTGAILKTLAPAAIAGAASVRKAGGDRLLAVRETAALFSAFSNRIGDVTGETTGTSVGNVSENLRKFFADRPDDPGSFFGRIQKVASDPNLQSLANVQNFPGARGVGKGAVTELLSEPDSQLFAESQRNLRSIKLDPEPFENIANAIQDATSGLRIGGHDRAIDTVRSQAQQANRLAQVRGLLSKTVATGLEQTGTGSLLDVFSDQINQLAFETASRIGDPFQEARAAMEFEKVGATPREKNILNDLLGVIAGLREDFRSMISQMAATAAQAQPTRHNEN